MIVLAMLLDAAFGDPRWLYNRVPHPVMIMGWIISDLEEWLNKGDHRVAKGALALCLLLALTLTFALLVQAIPGIWADTALIAILLAQRSLSDHVLSVARGLERSLKDGRSALAMIVSRDTKTMSASAVSRSAIESAAENLGDGVIAPLFWAMIFGLPGIAIYKAVNTADSMIGYRNARYEKFGKAAARLDDVLNWVPARLTGFTIWALTAHRGSWRDIATDARAHKSPNAGWPEAAIARNLGVALAGPRSYEGVKQEFPFVNPNGKKRLTAKDIRAANGVIWRVWGVWLIFAILLFAI